MTVFPSFLWFISNKLGRNQSALKKSPIAIYTFIYLFILETEKAYSKQFYFVSDKKKKNQK